MVAGFPISFSVKGTPVSLKARGYSRKQWVEMVKTAAKNAIPRGWEPYSQNLSVTIYDFPSDPPQGDIDNIIKRIQDAMNGIVYDDDKRVSRVVAQRFLPEEYEEISELPEMMAEALVNDPPFVYISIGEDPLGEAQ